MDALKALAVQHRHPELPVAVDPTLFGRNYFCRPSARVPKPAPPTASNCNNNGSNKKKKNASSSKRKAPEEASPLLAGNPPAKKKGRGNRKRPVNTPPATAKQQNDSDVRDALTRVRERMVTVQKMSLPILRQDGYDADNETDPSVWAQDEWPWAIHGLFYFTSLAPNEDGRRGPARFLDRKQLHMWAGSEAAKDELEANFDSLEGVDKIFHSTFKSYLNAQRSASALAKPPPPRAAKVGKEKTEADKSKEEGSQFGVI